MTIQRILVADGEESIRQVLTKALKRQGFNVDLAEDGLQARNLAQKQHYDLVLLDINIPGIQGTDLLKQFRTDHSNTLIIIMTAEAMMENTITAMRNGAYDYLTKPFDLTALAATILKAEKAAAQVLTAIDFPDLTAGKKPQRQDESLEALVAHKLENSLAQMNLQEMNNLYEMVLHQIERPLINIVLKKTRGNQIKTAEVLGINRNTLRKKIKILDIEVKRGN